MTSPTPEAMAREIVKQIPADCDEDYNQKTEALIAAALRDIEKMTRAERDKAFVGMMHRSARQARRAALEEAAQYLEHWQYPQTTHSLKAKWAEAIRALAHSDGKGEGTND